MVQSSTNSMSTRGASATDRALEITTLWEDTVLDTISVTDQETVTMGDHPRVTGVAPFQKIERCDVEIPGRKLPERVFPLAVNDAAEGASYDVQLPEKARGYIERADGKMCSLEQLFQEDRTAYASDVHGAMAYPLRNGETIYFEHDAMTVRMRYVWKKRFISPPWYEQLDHTWLNVLLIALFSHALAMVGFAAHSDTSENLLDDLLQNRNHFAQFKFKPEERRPSPASLLVAQLKAGQPAPKHKNKEGKAGRKNFKGKGGRMAVRGDPNDKDIAKSVASLLGIGEKTHRSYLFGTGGLGGELKSALGGVTGREIGDAEGLGGLGTRGSGPGGGGVSFNTVGLGALGTHGRGGGEGGFGTGVGSVGKKSDRGISIAMGQAIVQGSLDKELIRRVIQQHIAQIRYCYEKELQRSPGLWGKVGTEFIIKADGRVQSAKIKQSTLNNSSVEQCVASKIRSWQFPQPKGGGIVVVRYPFVFKKAG